jgi:membrane-associated phospholipid phosphatase
VARFLAHALNPALTTFLAIFLLSLSAAHWKVCASWIVLSGVFTILLPCSYFLWLVRKGKISEMYIPERTERSGPFLSLILFYALGALLLRWINASSSVIAALIVHTVNVALITGVTRFYKMSFHVMSAATSGGILFYFFGMPALLILVLIAALSWSRVYTRAHSLSQVLGGGLLGFFSALLQLEVLF